MNKQKIILVYELWTLLFVFRTSVVKYLSDMLMDSSTELPKLWSVLVCLPHVRSENNRCVYICMQFFAPLLKITQVCKFLRHHLKSYKCANFCAIKDLKSDTSSCKRMKLIRKFEVILKMWLLFDVSRLFEDRCRFIRRQISAKF